MATIVEIVENAIIPEPETEAQPGTAQPDDSTIETQLTQEISDLWSDHVRLSTSRKTTSKELRQIRASLAERLAAMKSLLSRPGRGGLWRSWLRERRIPRSTADRLVARHAETLCDDGENVPTGAISEPAKPTAEKLAETVWSSLKKVLTTGESVVEFIGCIAKVSGVPHEWQGIGLMIFYPVPEAADGLPGSAIAFPPAGPASPPSDEASAITEEPAAETVMATPANEDVARIADASDGDVL
jgi:hypothetical protein